MSVLTVALKSSDVLLNSTRPAGSGWQVQYFHGSHAITSKSKTSSRVVSMQPGAYSLTAVWTRTGAATVTSDAVIFELTSSSTPSSEEPAAAPVITSPVGGATVSESFDVTVLAPPLTTLATAQLINVSNAVVASWEALVQPQNAPQSVAIPVDTTGIESGNYSLTVTTTVIDETTNDSVAVILDNDAAPEPPEPGDKRVLVEGDFTYLGCMRVPETGVDMPFSYGGLTGRKVNGQVRLLMVGSDAAKGDHIYELADTGSYHADPDQAPRMTLVRAWGDIYGGKRVSWFDNGTSRTFPDTLAMAGFHFNETTQLLYWTYYSTYNVNAYQDWCLGATRLDTGGPVAYGPWRPVGAGGVGGTLKGPWRCLQIAEHPDSGEMLCGSRIQSGNGFSPWGPDLWAGQFPTAATPSGFGAADLPLQKYVTYYPMFNNLGNLINLDGTFTPPLLSCRRPGDYTYEPIPNITLTEIDPVQNGGVGSWTAVDGINGCVWLDLPDAHGVLFTGRLASGHTWYRNAGGGNNLCTHGQSAPIDVTGPVSTAMYPAMLILDPADVAEVRAGTKVDYTVDLASTINAETAFSLVTGALGNAGSAKTLGGCYFDATTGKLYICAPQADDSIAPTFLNPIVHVFQVSDD